jgi:hypothetical protein
VRVRGDLDDAPGDGRALQPRGKRLPGRSSQGTAFRTFDLARRVWSIYWVSSLDGLLGEPVHGGFEGGVGRFYGVALDGGRPVKVAFVWVEITDTSAHWSQAFSYDDGKHWEVNWTMAFTRTGPAVFD